MVEEKQEGAYFAPPPPDKIGLIPFKRVSEFIVFGMSYSKIRTRRPEEMKRKNKCSFFQNIVV